MDQNKYSFYSTSHGSPPPLTNNDYSALMGSLISPGPATPLQSAFAPPWPGQAVWQQNGRKGSYPYSMPYQNAPMNQTMWHNNGQQAYMGQEDDDDELITIDDTDILGPTGQQATQHARASDMMHGIQYDQEVQSSQLHNHAPSGPITQSRLGNVAGGAPIQGTKSTVVNSAARAAELRAKLLANKSSNAASRQGSPAVKTTEQTDATKANVGEALKQANGALASLPAAKDSIDITANPHIGNEIEGESTVVAPNRSSGQPVTNMDFEYLFAEAQNAANTHKMDVAKSNGTESNEEKDLDPEVSNTAKRAEAATQVSQPALMKSVSSSELSEPGEIHSETTSPKNSKMPAKVAESQGAKQAKEDKNEKLIRQNEVKKAYQPLKDSKAPTSEPTADSRRKSGADTSSARPSFNVNTKEPPEPSRRPLKATTQQQLTTPNPGLRGGEYEPHGISKDSRLDSYRERPRDYDRRDEDRFRRPLPSHQSSRESGFRRDSDGYRQKPLNETAKRNDDNARNAAEYKRSLEFQRTPVLQRIDGNTHWKEQRQKQDEGEGPAEASTRDVEAKDSCHSVKNVDVRNEEPEPTEPDQESVMFSPGVQNNMESNEDINDWLELSNFYDQEFREKRLGIFRRKRALALQQAELEREEQELQGIPFVARAQSTIPANSAPKPARRPAADRKMPPPPLPLKEPNNDVGIKIKDSALLSGLPTPQSTTPTLKRQHTEDDRETGHFQPVEKQARLDVNGLSNNEKALISPASVKGTHPRVKTEPMPLEHRITRDDNDRYTARQRGRSRSPEMQRRSMSPRRRRYSDDYSPEPRTSYSRNYNGIVRENSDCHNCGRSGHFPHQCTEPRRDSKDYSASTRHQHWVSPNYRGRNPISRPDARSGEDRPRYNSVGKPEDSLLGNPRHNIGSRELNLEAGGQYRHRY